MRFLNLGNKDEYGRQRRIEHRGRYLRASRTGGVALRAQTKAAGLTFTGNTARGARLSATPARNTQVAFQNGRFILRGRYASGPFRLNLSKSGLSLSSRNALGSFNWTNPLRSSARVAGVQVRGKSAAIMQAVYMVLVVALYLLQGVLALALLALRVLLTVAGWIMDTLAALPGRVREWRRGSRNARLARSAAALEREHGVPFGDWGFDRLLAALLLVVGARGRGEDVGAAATRFAQSLADAPGECGLARAAGALGPAADALAGLWPSGEHDIDDDLAVVVILAQRLRERLPPDVLGEVLLEVDEQALADGPRTRLQDRMLEVFADFAGLRLEAPEGEEAATDAGSGEGAAGVIDINTASLEQLQALPDIGPARARAIMAMRPLGSLDALAALDGIGPKRLQAIRDSGVVCGVVE